MPSPLPFALIIRQAASRKNTVITRYRTNLDTLYENALSLIILIVYFTNEQENISAGI
jgi:hypothetical protein